jgi:LexA DNA binding domain
MLTVRVFKYIEQLDAFVVTDEYCYLADRLGLTEWNTVVWIGRLFTLDNDYGEHWFDNWDERQALAGRAHKLGIASDELMILVPDRLKNDADGPCHSPVFRKQFWTDVLTSLELSYDTLFEEARQYNAIARERLPDEFIEDLEERIAAIRASLDETGSDTINQIARRMRLKYTPRQGQYLAFIYYYTKLHGYPPAEADMQRFFKVSPRAVHDMILMLEKQRLIERTPRQSRSIRVLLPPQELPSLE